MSLIVISHPSLLPKEWLFQCDDPEEISKKKFEDRFSRKPGNVYQYQNHFYFQITAEEAEKVKGFYMSQSHKQPRMYLDIETQANPENLELMPEPVIEAPVNYKDPAKIAEYIAEKTAAA